MTKPQTIHSLPQPKGELIFGNLRKFKVPHKHLVFEEWVRECGSLFRISLMGKKFIVSADPDINHEILKRRPESFRRFSNIAAVMEEMGIHGVFAAEGESWKQHRKLVAEALNARNVQAFYPTLKEISNRLLRKWKRAATTGEIIDVQREMMRYTVDITTAIAFGYPMNTLEEGNNALQNQLEHVFPMINSRITAPFPMWRYFPSKQDKAFANALKEIKETVQTFIQNAEKRLRENPELKEQPTNFLEALLVERLQDPTFTDKDIFGNVFTLLLAGEDTTSNSLSWTLFLLTQHPEYIQKIREEALLIYPDSDVPIDYETMKRLKFTEAVVMESMRLKPVTPSLYMQANETIVINGLQIEKGMTVMLQNKVAQIQDTNFSEAGQFLPERWLDTSKCPVHNPDVIRVFGGGPRYCPGKTLAMNELIHTISLICKHFDLELTVPANEVKEVFAFTMYPENCLIRLKIENGINHFNYEGL